MAIESLTMLNNSTSNCSIIIFYPDPPPKKKTYYRFFQSTHKVSKTRVAGLTIEERTVSPTPKAIFFEDHFPETGISLVVK